MLIDTTTPFNGETDPPLLPPDSTGAHWRLYFRYTPYHPQTLDIGAITSDCKRFLEFITDDDTTEPERLRAALTFGGALRGDASWRLGRSTECVLEVSLPGGSSAKVTKMSLGSGSDNFSRPLGRALAINRMCVWLTSGSGYVGPYIPADMRMLHKCILREPLCRRWLLFRLEELTWVPKKKSHHFAKALNRQLDEMRDAHMPRRAPRDR